MNKKQKENEGFGILCNRCGWTIKGKDIFDMIDKMAYHDKHDCHPGATKKEENES